MKIALAQINTIVGDLRGNAEKIVAYAHDAQAQGADLVAFPELALTGYPHQDLLDRPFFVEATQQALAWVTANVPEGLGVVLGAPLHNPSKTGKRLVNAAVLIEDGAYVAEVHKMLLPTYDVFDEYRYFEPSLAQTVVTWRGVRIGLHICEDMWNHGPDATYHVYKADPIAALAEQGVDLFLNISASPFAVGRHTYRNQLVADISEAYKVPFAIVNNVGANTEIVFDGGSRVCDADGNLIVSAPAFEESLILWDTEATYTPLPENREPIADLYDALVIGIRDYFEKTGVFSKALVGLSGGIDSAVTCALAVAALGPEKVVGVTMPSKYSSSGSVDDSGALANALDIEFHNIPIVPAVAAFEDMLTGIFAGTQAGVAEENIQARTRGVTLMAISNKFNHLLLTTGNKSEMSVGYATLYGDMNGGLAVLSDVFKMQVYALANYINERAGREVIPQNTIDKAPSAELRPDQKDEDSLPSYPVLDKILQLYIEEQLDADAIVLQTGYDEALVLDILRKVDRNEYKRRQAPPGLRVTHKAFGVGRRLPIVMRWNREMLATTA